MADNTSSTFFDNSEWKTELSDFSTQKLSYMEPSEKVSDKNYARH